jgi:hypothetical protein
MSLPQLINQWISLGKHITLSSFEETQVLNILRNEVNLNFAEDGSDILKNFDLDSFPHNTDDDANITFYSVDMPEAEPNTSTPILGFDSVCSNFLLHHVGSTELIFDAHSTADPELFSEIDQLLRQWTTVYEENEED